jgi:hypothetical protein
MTAQDPIDRFTATRARSRALGYDLALSKS